MDPIILTREIFVYSGEAILLIPTYLTYWHAVQQSWRLVRHNRGIYYRALLVLVVCRTLDYSLNHVATTAPLTHDQYAATVTLEMCFQWPAGIGITILNMLRLYRVCKSWIPRSIRVMTAAVTVSFIFNFYIYVVYIGTVVAGNSTTYINQVFMIWSAYDVFLNVAISALFIAYLRMSSTHTYVGGKSMRAGLGMLLHKIQCILPMEVAVTISNALLQFLAPSLDPYWAYYYFSEAIRLAVFSTFLISLNQVMHGRNNTASKGLLARSRVRSSGTSRVATVVKSAPFGCGSPGAAAASATAAPATTIGGEGTLDGGGGVGPVHRVSAVRFPE